MSGPSATRLGVFFALVALFSIPFVLACGGCPRLGRSAGTGESETVQTVASHESPDHVILVDDAFVVDAADVALDPVPLDADTVRAVIATQGQDLRRCYERARSEHPDMAGRMVLELYIASSGHVLSAAIVENETGDGVLSTCFSDCARHWHFPRSAHDVTLRYPFALGPTPPSPDGSPTVTSDAVAVE